MLRIALLVCDTPIKDVLDRHGDYSVIFSDFLHQTCDEFVLVPFDVVRESYPPPDADFDALLITGSSASAYKDIAWIDTLVAYVARIVLEKPHLKIFGICFGHQIVARALGVSCVPNDRWEVAATTVHLTPIGKAIFSSDQLDIQQMHRDHVPTLPPNAHLLGSTDIAHNQGMVIFEPDFSPDLTSDAPSVPLTAIRVLTVQGHPEFTEPIMTKLLNARVALLGQELVNEARSRAGGVPGRDGPCDALTRVGKVIWGVLDHA